MSARAESFLIQLLPKRFFKIKIFNYEKLKQLQKVNGNVLHLDLDNGYLGNCICSN